MDNAWEYNDGISEEYTGTALARAVRRSGVDDQVCTHGRDKATAIKQLGESLRRPEGDHIDLWQVHD